MHQEGSLCPLGDGSVKEKRWGQAVTGSGRRLKPCVNRSQCRSTSDASPRRRERGVFGMTCSEM